ncbi:MAG: S9 family peptidase [Bacteroidales bacterium]|nr:S9 family peptidase [Bacteroidales bacterium]
MNKNSILLKIFMITALIIQQFAVQSQTKKIELKDIWASRTFSPELVHGMNPLQDGKTYSVIEDGGLNVYSFESGDLVSKLIEAKDLALENTEKSISLRSYIFNHDESKVLIPTETESIYRHSTRSFFYVYDLKSKKLEPLSENGKQQLATFSPDGTQVAFARENNIFIRDLINQTEKQITFDGKTNEIINGTTDWVYEEEFGFTQAFFWSGDSKKIAFYRFDESAVKEFQMTYYNGLYPEQYKYKYPKAGEDNSIVSIHIWDSNLDKTLKMNVGEESDIYLPRISWTQNPNILSIQRLNRHQNHFEILFADANLGDTKLIYEEKSPYYIDITDNLTFLPDGKHFIISSEKDGYNHLYLYDLQGKLVKQLTRGNWDVTQLYGFSPKYKKVYFQSAQDSPLERNIYTVDLKGKTEKISILSGQNSATFSSDYSFFINTNSNINTPYYITVNNSRGKELRILKDNARLKEKMADYQFGKFSFFTINDPEITLPDGKQISLNCWQLLPPDFDPSKKYPVLVYVYGGPGSQTVNNSWGGANHLWFQMLAQKGIIIVSVDNRGTGSRGELFKKMTYKELGKYETEDLITTARYLASLKYVDENKIGVFGWSYGGYMSSLAITKGAEDYSAAIAVAPVTNWRYYDNIYTERYMQKPEENNEGYDQNSPINHVDKLKGNYLLIHGSGDDNVHYQNTMEMINALVDADKHFELMIYPNRNHGIHGGNTRMHLYEMMTDFLERSLLK